MMSGPSATLMHPFSSGALAIPESGRFLFLDAEPGFRLPDGFGAELHIVQGFRPHFRALVSAGYGVKPEPEGHDHDGALILAGRHRGRNEGWIAEALARVVPNGLILVAGGSDDGIGSLRKRIGSLVDLDGSLPKYHGAAFWFRRPDDPASVIDALRPDTVAVGDRFSTLPGMFSHDHVDRASRLLVDCLPEKAEGSAADFGAGWGYLAAELAARTRGLRAVDLYEADHASLEAAKANLGRLAGGPEFEFHWFDLVGEKVGRTYDFIVMNPPFHQGRAADPGIGQAFIRAASSALRPGGQLLMVANRGLPYDQSLKSAFGSVKEIRNEAGFRVLSAIR